MLSGSNPTTTALRPERARIRLKPVGSGGAVSGGWWPRSADLIEQLPSLLAELVERIGGVHRVEYNVSDWPTAPARLQLGERWIRLDGSLTQHPQSISLDSTLGRETLTLLVVPCETEPVAAIAALDAAAVPGSGSSIRALLVAAGVAVDGRRVRGLTRSRQSVRDAHAPGETFRSLAAQAESSATAQSRAARTVAGRADDLEDCRLLLAMLGLDGQSTTEQL